MAKPSHFRCVIVWAAAGTLAAPALAEIRAGGNQLMLEAGWNRPLGSISLAGAGGGESDTGGKAARFGVQYLRHVSERVSAGMEMLGAPRRATLSRDLMPGGISRVDSNEIIGMVLIRLSFAPSSWVHPYVLGGFGGHVSSLSVKTTPVGSSVWTDTGTAEERVFVDDTQTGGAGALRLGVEADLGPFLVVAVEGGFEHLGPVAYEPSATAKRLGLAVAQDPFGNLAASARIGVRF